MAARTRRFRAPGRVNLIGAHVDYHEGPVVAMAIDHEVVVTMRPRDDRRVVVRSDATAGTVVVASDGSDDPAGVAPAWGRLVGGAVRALVESDRPPSGADLRVVSTLTIGGGLSSSAAFEVAVVLALAATAGHELSGLALALAAQRAEHLGSGVPCGIQDQMAAVVGGTFLLDCRTLAVESLPLPDDLAVVVVDSGVSRTLDASPWATRRAETFAAAEALGLRVLRDARPDEVARSPRARHVVDEMARVRAYAAALRAADRAALGTLMLRSHAGSRDDMESSIAELDTLVDCLMEAGAIGARLTGGGFGGCCVALAPTDRADRVARDAASAYAARTGRRARPMVVGPAPGAGELVG